MEAACKTVDPAAILLTNRTAAKAEVLAQRLGCQVTTSNSQVAQNAKWIFLGVKPQMMAGVLKEIAPVLAARKDRFILVSMAAGLRLETLGADGGGGLSDSADYAQYPGGHWRGYDLLYPQPPDDRGGGSRTSAPFWLPAVSWTGCRNPCWTPARRVAGCGGAFCNLFLEALADGVWPAACPGRRRCCMRPKWSSARPS